MIMSIDSVLEKESRGKNKAQSQIGIESLFSIRVHTRKKESNIFGGLAMNTILFKMDNFYEGSLCGNDGDEMDFLELSGLF